MAYRLLITEKAEADLDGILQYLMMKLANPEAAATLLDAIEAVYQRLTERPAIYALCQHPLLKPMGYRKAVIRGYLMIYRLDTVAQTVYIERFFSDLEDYANKI